jgi:hypothetical protein
MADQGSTASAGLNLFNGNVAEVAAARLMGFPLRWSVKQKEFLFLDFLDYRVFVNGVKIPFCTEYDIVAGYARGYSKDPNVLRDREIPRQFIVHLRGKVTLQR